MKKTILVLVFAAFTTAACAFSFKGLDWEAGAKYGRFGRNLALLAAQNLEHQYGISVHVFKFNADSKIDTFRLALAYYNTLTRTAQDEIVLVWLNKKKGQGEILASDAALKKIPKRTLDILAENVLRPLANKWYANEEKLSSKIIGTLIYEASGRTVPHSDLLSQYGGFIKVDDPLFSLSVMQPFSDIIALFFIEPISFFLYFPFVLYALLVRIIGSTLGRSWYAVFSVLWAGLTILVFAMIINRAIILFPEYISVVSMFIAFNMPLYIAIYLLNQDKFEVAAYSYLHNVTGGFASSGFFGDSK